MTDINIRLMTLKKYLDMSFINTILCDSHYNYYNKLSAIVMFPTIIGSALLTILNSSSIDEEKMKYINVALNGLNTIIMTLSTQYKLNDRLTIYKNSYTKFNKLSHKIESIINNTQETNDRIIDDIIAEYDNIVNDNSYGYLSSYKKKIIQKYGKSKVLPNSLQLEASTIISELVEVQLKQ
jgi:Glu-tRNA(Gln) amidotransferase subunit E-like FAD-binding protein